MSKFLYDLVKSLTSSEKIYFKRNAKIHNKSGDKNYLKIYNLIDGLTEYDQDAFTKHFKGTTINKYQSTEVKYLIEKILLSLFNYNLNKTKKAQIQKGILILEALVIKGFRKQALKKVKSLKKSALNLEEFTSIIRLIELEEKILYRQGVTGYRAKLLELHEQKSHINLVVENLGRYHILRQEVREFQFNEHKLHANMKMLDEFCDNQLVKSKENCLSIRALEHWYYINVLINYLRTDFDTGLKISKQYVDFILKNTKLFDKNELLPILSNYIYHAALTQNIEHFEKGKAIILILSKQIGTPDYYVNYILYTRHIELSYYTKNETMMRKYLKLTLALLKNDLNLFEEAQIQYLYLTIVKSLITLKDYKQAMYHCNLWHRRGVMSYRKVQARLLSIIVHFEENYLNLIESEIVILKKLVKKNVSDEKLINCFYSFFTLIIKQPESRDSHIKKFQRELKSISTTETGRFSFIFFDYYKWSSDLQ